ncbi:MAG: thioredoxin-dependent thiol peroxidase [Chitinivibrionales bacterium]|nr:thioredoxin-dependent thiol peroxidase [Chitinivibrionales bacterium]
MAQLKSGDTAPAFALKDQNGADKRLSDFAGKKVLLYFYPKADTPGCTTQSCSVRDSLSELSQKGIVALGISPDLPEKQTKFDKKHGLGFPLLSDPDHAVAKKYGVWGEKSMYEKKYMGINRSSFFIDETGAIIQAWYKVAPKDTVPNVMKII